jgi:hypothetical protein
MDWPDFEDDCDDFEDEEYTYDGFNEKDYE